MVATTTAGNERPRLFVSDLEKHEIVIETDPDGRQIARRVPIIRVGTWNGYEYTADDLREIADNFATIRDRDRFEPPLKPRHTYGADGNGPEFDARDVLGWWKSLTFDEGKSWLVGDAHLVGDGVAAAMASGVLRYISAEIVDSYTVTGDTEGLGAALIGSAFVECPAVTGMDWRVIVNREEFAVAGGRAEVKSPQRQMQTQRNKETEGGRIVTPLAKKLKELFGRLGIGAEDLADLDGLEEVAEPADPAEPGATQELARPVEALSALAAGEPLVAGEAPASGETPTTPTDPAVIQLNAQLAETQKALDAEIATNKIERERGRVARVTQLVDTLVEGGHVPPADRQATFVLANHLTRAETPVKMLSAQRPVAEGDDAEGASEPVEIEVTLTDVFTDLIKNLGAHIPGKPRGMTMTFMGSAFPDAEPVGIGSEEASKIIDEMVGKRADA